MLKVSGILSQDTKYLNLLGFLKHKKGHSRSLTKFEISSTVPPKFFFDKCAARDKWLSSDFSGWKLFVTRKRFFEIVLHKNKGLVTNKIMEILRRIFEIHDFVKNDLINKGEHSQFHLLNAIECS